MLKAIVAALALGFAVPALADKGDTKKDIKDAAADATDKVKDTLHTDKGADKAKRHMNKSARAAKRKARHTKNNVKVAIGGKELLRARGGPFRPRRPAACLAHPSQAT